MDRDENKKLLCIAHVFPPNAGVAGTRISGFVRFLPKYGWKPILLTVNPNFYKRLDKGSMRHVPADTLIFRTSSMEQNKFLKFLQSMAYSKKAMLGKICFIVYQLLVFPDIYVWWVPFAVLKGVKLCKQYNIDAIFATGEPYSDFIIAYLISKICHKPYILDVRDPWTLNNFWGTLTTIHKQPNNIFGVLLRYCAILRLKFERFLEYLVFKNASYVIFVGETVCHAYQKEYPLLASKFMEISNGFFPEDFDRVSENQLELKSKSKKILSYVGGLYSFRFPHTFMAALREIYKTYPNISEKLKILFVGFVDPEIIEQIEKEDFKNMILYTGEITRDEAMNYIVSSDALLLLCGDSAWEQPAKIFDYIISKRPIIAVASEGGEVERIINETKTGIVINHGQTKKMIDTIINIISNTNKLITLNKKDIEKYNRRYLTKKLVSILCDAQ